MIYECIEDFKVNEVWYKEILGEGTIKAGSKFELIREPIPKKKLYKLQQIDTKFPQILYLRRSQLNYYFKKLE